jgi:phosphatidylglycerophosphatase A
MIKLFVTVFYLGFLPYAPGTIGSIVAILIGYWIQIIGGFPLLMSCVIVFFFVGWAFTDRYISQTEASHDPQEIVIDEVVGQWISYLPISFYIWKYELTIIALYWFSWVIVLILFRIFDIWKPWPVIWADRKNSSLGVMLDDVLAGIYVAIIISVLIVVTKLGGSL